MKALHIVPLCWLGILMPCLLEATPVTNEVVTHKQCRDGQNFSLRYLEVLTPITNFALFLAGANATTSSPPAFVFRSPSMTNFACHVIASLSSASGNVPTPVWSNSVSWDNFLVAQWRSGFVFLDAESFAGNFLICYKASFDTFVELIPTAPGEPVPKRLRWKLCSEDLNHGYATDRAVISISSNRTPQVVLSGPLGQFEQWGRVPYENTFGNSTNIVLLRPGILIKPRNVESLTWNLEGEKWKMESLGTNKLDTEFSVRLSTDSWRWESNGWFRLPPK